jgi:molybdenum cofactor biosynthesis enzyme
MVNLKYEVNVEAEVLMAVVVKSSILWNMVKIV